MTALFFGYFIIAGLAAVIIVGVILRRRNVAYWPAFVAGLAAVLVAVGLLVGGALTDDGEEAQAGVVESRRSIVFPLPPSDTTSPEADNSPEQRVEPPALIPTPTPDTSTGSAGGSGNPAPSGEELARDLTHAGIREVVERTDRPVAEGMTQRDWIWGPWAITPPITEPYTTLPSGVRTVQYFDKGRLEVAGEDEGEWPVTGGLLVVEMMAGRVQLGADEFEEREPADIPVVDAASDGPTYADLIAAAEAPELDEGELITTRLEAGEELVDAPILGTRGIRAVSPVGSGEHSIAAPFWDFMNSSGTIYETGSYRQADLFIDPYFVTGRPVTEPFWVRRTGSDSPGDMLVQCFERRCLLYAPAGGATWRVSSTDVGRHYFRWRYGVSGSVASDPSA